MKTKVLTKIALFLALIIVSGFIAIPIPGIGVPIVLQNMMIMLAGGFLGKRWGTLTVGSFLLLVLVGFPLLSGGRGGPVVFYGPSTGFLIGYLFSAFTIGFMFEKVKKLNFWTVFLIYLIGGAFIIDFCGSFSLAYFSQTSWFSGLKIAAFFLPVDTLKAIVATWITLRLRDYTFREDKK